MFGVAGTGLALVIGVPVDIPVGVLLVSFSTSLIIGRNNPSDIDKVEALRYNIEAYKKAAGEIDASIQTLAGLEQVNP